MSLDLQCPHQLGSGSPLGWQCLDGPRREEDFSGQCRPGGWGVLCSHWGGDVLPPAEVSTGGKPEMLLSAGPRWPTSPLRDGCWCPRKLSDPVWDSGSKPQTLRGGDASWGLSNFPGGQAPSRGSALAAHSRQRRPGLQILLNRHLFPCSLKTK